MITFFKNVFSLLIGVGKKPEQFEVNFYTILFTALGVGTAFLGSISLLMIAMKFLTE
tara:strand:+ start:906 stop:1076 length:171 start_codon:yes stop_codon:yes gene_type:complete